MEITAWFEERGVQLKIEEDGRIDIFQENENFIGGKLGNIEGMYYEEGKGFYVTS